MMVLTPLAKGDLLMMDLPAVWKQKIRCRKTQGADDRAGLAGLGVFPIFPWEA